jgi:hypothetical protein
VNVGDLAGDTDLKAPIGLGEDPEHKVMHALRGSTRPRKFALLGEGLGEVYARESEGPGGDTDGCEIRLHSP